MKKDIETVPSYTRCEDEPIHIPESIQGFGHLLAIDPQTGSIKVHSANMDELFKDWASTRKISFFDIIDEDEVPAAAFQETFGRVAQTSVRLPIPCRFKESFLKDGTHCDFHSVVYSSSGLMVVEIEPAVAFKGKIASRQHTKLFTMNTAPRYSSHETISDLSQYIVDMVRAFTGYERVLIYKFNPDRSGQVIAESKVKDIGSYLGLFSPESDIPKQARELYKKNWLRVTANADSKPVALCPSVAESGRKPLDLTYSLLRSMSPVHLEYLRNQGLKSSMSISLYSQEDLWGLILCQHREEFYLPQDMRLELEGLAHLFSWQLYAKEEELLHHKRLRADATINTMIQNITDTKDIGTIFEENEEQLLRLMDACGFLFSYADHGITLGDVPPPDISNAILEKAGKSSQMELTEIDNVYEYLGIKVESDILGALLLPLLSENNYYTIWFRRKKVWERKWAGNPEEKTIDSDKLERLKPRKSFVVHTEVIDNRCEPWTLEDKRIADLFNRVFLQHALRSQVLMQKNIDILNAQDKSKNEFLATLAHELRNPLAPISSAIELLRMDESGEYRLEAATVVERQLKQLVTLIDDLMDVSRITRGRVILKKEKHSLNDILENAIEASKNFMKARNHKLEVLLSQQEIEVSADVTRLTQVLSNVLNNAAKYTEPGGRIKIKSYSADRFAIIEIADNGIGISSEYLPRIFDMFSQADPFSPKGSGGLGIGLTLSKKLIELHDGDITVKSEGLGKGSTFLIKIPRLAPAKQNQAAKAEDDKTKNPVNKYRVLIVDDNIDSARMLELMIKSKGHFIQTAHTGVRGLELFKSFRPDFVLLDIGLPDMDGYEVCQAIRASEGGNEPVIVAQTGWGQDEHIKRSQRAGFDKHLVKPISPKDIWAIFEKTK